MTVILMAKYPWQDVEGIASVTNEEPGVFVFSDSRLSHKDKPLLEYEQVKQFKLADNCLVAYASSHVAATLKAIETKRNQFTPRVTGYMATERDLSRLGKIFRDVHNEYGGISDVLGTVWSRQNRVPEIYEIMSPGYVPREVSGVLGCGDPKVLDWVEQGLPEQLISQGLTADNVRFDVTVICSLQKQFPGYPNPIAKDDVRMALHVAFTEALTSVGSYSASIPITSSELTGQGILQYESAVLSPTNKLTHTSKFTKEGFDNPPFKLSQTESKKRFARVLFK